MKRMPLDEAYTILVSRKFNKYVKKKLPRSLKKALDRKVKFLAQNPYHTSLNTKKLKVSRRRLRDLEVDHVYEFRINMGFRCVFYVRNKTKTIILARVGNHGDVRTWF
ncbi:hypothetical protein GF360_01150 [candidate division WWE3 bacterium]|nr:hypothetical protein [candidate division WWE3 bacterium]